MSRITVALATAVAGLGAAQAAHAAAPEPKPVLEGRAILPADATAPAPFPGVPDTDPAPGAGATQPVGGFSALLEAPGRDTFWAMPDNGFGSKLNSRSFLLRVYKVRADFETRSGGEGGVEVLDSITLRDPDDQVPFAIVNQGTRERLLTGGDFDVESMRIDPEGDLWFGEEFGPFLLHTDATGKVLEPPIPLPDVKSPDHPADAPAPIEGEANLARSNGFEGMALSEDGRHLYPVLEGPVAGDDPRVRRVYEFDVRRGEYTGRELEYRVWDPSHLVSDFTALDSHSYLALERDNAEGVAARHKQGFVVDLRNERRDGALAKERVFDLLGIRDPAGLSLPARPGDVGLGDPFSLPYVTIEAVLPVGGDRVAIVNDTNFGSRGRNPEQPDYSDIVVLRAPGLQAAARELAPGGVDDDEEEALRGGRRPSTLAVIGDTPYGDEQVERFPQLIADVNRDPRVGLVLHVGDIKNGSSPCTDQRFRDMLALYDAFRDPFLYTPGDNEWTDCHREAAGGYLPTERLHSLREVFYPEPGEALGGDFDVITQADEPGHEEYVENQLWMRSRVAFSTLHVVGSNNGLAPWFGDAETEQQRGFRLQEFEDRMEANLAWLERTFDAAERRDARGVVIAMQADTFVDGPVEGYTPIVARLAELAAEFRRPVLLLQGDTHEYLVDRPLAAGSAVHGVTAAAPNVTRIVVEGETADEWLRLRVDPRTRSVFSWSRRDV